MDNQPPARLREALPRQGYLRVRATLGRNQATRWKAFLISTRSRKEFQTFLARALPRDPRIYLLFGVVFIVAVGFGIVLPLLPFLARDLGANDLLLGVLTASYALTQFVFSPYWGSVSDRVGRRRILTVGTFGLAISFFAMAIAPTFWWLLFIRVAGGVLSAATIPTAQAYAADLTEPKHRAQVMGLMGAAVGLGFVFGPAIGGVLNVFGTAVPFIGGGVLALATTIGCWRMLPESKGQSEPEKSQDSRWATIAKSLRSPIAPYFWLTLIVMLGNASIFSFLGVYLDDRYNAGVGAATAAFVLLGIASAFIQGFLVGRLIQRFGEDKTIVIALVSGGIGFAGLALSPSLWIAMLFVMIGASGMSLARPAVTAAISTTTPFEQGVSLGVQTSFDSLGRVLGPFLAGLMYFGGVTIPYWVSALLYLVTANLVLRWIRWRTNIEGREGSAAGRS